MHKICYTIIGKIRKNGEKKMYKLLVIDLDGTLLNDEKEIPTENKVAIQRLHDEFGVIPVIATARPLEVARYIANQGGDAFQSYIIATNGAILMDIQKGEYFINQSLLPTQIEELISTCEKNHLEYEFMTTKCEVADAKYSYRRVIDPMYDNMGIPFNYQENLREYIAQLQDSIPLFAVNGTEEELQECYNELAGISGLQISNLCTRTTPGDAEGNLDSIAYYDIMREGVTKASAIQKLAEHLGIPKEEIIAIGDGGNDVEMLQMAGLKIAMKNANDSLKEIADIVTPVDNNAGGVGITIEALCNSLRKEREMDKVLSENNLEEQKRTL